MTDKTKENADKPDEVAKEVPKENYGYDPKALVSCPSGEMIDPTDSENLRTFGTGLTKLGKVTPWMNLQLKAGKLVLDADE